MRAYGWGKGAPYMRAIMCRKVNLRQAIQFAMRELRQHIDRFISIGTRFSAVGLGFLVTFTIGRELGPHAVGQLGIVTETGMVHSILCIGVVDLSHVKSFVEAKASVGNPVVAAFFMVTVFTVGLMLLVSAVLLLALNFMSQNLLEGTNTPIFISVIIIVFLREVLPA